MQYPLKYIIIASNFTYADSENGNTLNAFSTSQSHQITHVSETENSYHSFQYNIIASNSTYTCRFSSGNVKLALLFTLSVHYNHDKFHIHVDSGNGNLTLLFSLSVHYVHIKLHVHVDSGNGNLLFTLSVHSNNIKLHAHICRFRKRKARTILSLFQYNAIKSNSTYM